MEFGALRSPGYQETKYTGWGGRYARSWQDPGGPISAPLQGASVSLSETVQKWREYRRQCQRFLTETPPPATGESRWDPHPTNSPGAFKATPQAMVGHHLPLLRCHICLRPWGASCCCITSPLPSLQPQTPQEQEPGLSILCPPQLFRSVQEMEEPPANV